jgi:hypothetical protein
MSLTSEQAKALSAAPRMTPEVVDQAVSMYAEGATDAEVHERFPTWAAGTFRNLRGRKKAEIDDLRRARTVQFTDIAGVRKQARLDDYWGQRTAYMMLFREHLASCLAINPVTGEKEFVEQLVDARKLKIYSDMIGKFNKLLALETGQLLTLDDGMAAKVLGLDGKNGIDYPQIVTELPERERQQQVRQEWHWHDMFQRYRSVTDDDADAREQVQRLKDRESGMSPREAFDARLERSLERQREENYGNFEQWITDHVVKAWTEYGIDGVTADELAEDVKFWMPQADDVAAEVDEWFAGPLFAAMVEAARLERSLERKREENYGNFEQWITDHVVKAWTEYGIDGVTADELAEDVKFWMPQADDVAAEVDEWFAGPLFAAMVEAARKPAPQPELTAAAANVAVPVVLEQPDPHLQFRHADLQDRLAYHYEVGRTVEPAA